MPTPLTVYLAGELFSLKHLHGNAALAEAIHELSGGRFVPILPQNLEQRDTTPHAIRDQDLQAVIACDAGLFHYDGTELDSGTVVEYLFAKCADIPAVLLRTDFRSSGDQAGDPWNLMTSFFPRTEKIVVDAMSLYQSSAPFAGATPESLLQNKTSTTAARLATETLARQIIAALERVIARPPVLPPASREAIYTWLAHFPNFRSGPAEVTAQFLAHLARKEDKGLL